MGENEELNDSVFGPRVKNKSLKENNWYDNKGLFNKLNITI